MEHLHALELAAARAFLELWTELGPEVLGEGDTAAIEALRALVGGSNDRSLQWMAPANTLPV